MASEDEFAKYSRSLDPIKHDNRLNSGSVPVRIVQFLGAVAVFVVIGSYMSSDVRRYTIYVTGFDPLRMSFISTHLERDGSIRTYHSSGSDRSRAAFGSWSQSYDAAPRTQAPRNFLDRIWHRQ